MTDRGEGEVTEMPTGTRGETEECFQIATVDLVGPGGLPAADDEDSDEDEQENHTADHRHQQHSGVSAISDNGRGN